MDKVSKRLYKKLYPKYLKWLGVNIDVSDCDKTWISPTVFIDSSHYDYLKIGKNVTISFNVSLLVHDYSITHAAWAINRERNNIIYKNITISDNVFIGANSTILPGAFIGKNCVIGAGAVVKGKCEENSVYAGNPAKRICGIEEFAHKYESLLK